MLTRLLRRGVIAGVALVGVETAYAILRPAPELPSFDPSGEFGDPSNPRLRIAVLGDSSVTAPGVAGPEQIWITHICRWLAKDYHVILDSVAIGGATAGSVLEKQMENAILFGPDLIFVSVGANDALKAVPRRRFERNLDLLIGRLSETGATVVQSGVGALGAIPRLFPPLSNVVARRARRFDAVHREVAERHGTHVVDHSSDIDLWRRDRSLWSPDLFHASAAGHNRWADMAWRTIGPLVSRDAN